MKNDLLIVGVGNPLRHDDGIGPEIITQLRTNNVVAGRDLPLLDLGTDGFALLDEIPKYQRVLIIDAVEMGTDPGTVKIFSPDEAKMQINSDALSTHGFGLAEVIKLMEQLDINTDVQIIGIQPENISFGEGLSEIVASKIPEILRLILNCCREHI